MRAIFCAFTLVVKRYVSQAIESFLAETEKERLQSQRSSENEVVLKVEECVCLSLNLAIDAKHGKCRVRHMRRGRVGMAHDFNRSRVSRIRKRGARRCQEHFVYDVPKL
jgi:hypothetical protein